MIDPLSDIEIVELCREKVGSGERLLFAKYYPGMLKLCERYVGSEFEAKEVLSDGFIKVFKNLSAFEFRDGKGLQSWIKKIMVNESLMHIRKNGKLKMNVSLDQAENVAFLEYEETVDAEILHDSIRQLPAGYRAVLNLYIVEGYSHKEIAQKLGISESASRSQLTHARKKMQKLLKDKL